LSRSNVWNVNDELGYVLGELLVIEENEENEEKISIEEEITEIINGIDGESDILEEENNQEEITADALKERDRFKSIAQRAQADLVNYRTRTIQEKDEIRRTVKFGIISRFIGVSDDLERAIEEIPDDVEKGWKEGILLVLRNFENSLEIEGVKKIKSLGELFDPYQHEALLYEKTSKSPEGTILNVIQNGYILNDKILRPARVVVAQENDLDDNEENINKVIEDNPNGLKE
tara:strand:+ start:1118 stop:1813 length:696 start_codon:yes stop_codon:yes gene_type:complete